MTVASRPPAPGTPAPSPPPGGPTRPTPTGPGPQRYADAFDLALTLGPDTAVDLARPHKPRPPSKPPRKPAQTKPIRGTQSPARQDDGSQVPGSAAIPAGGPVQPDSEGGRAGDPLVPGAVSEFTLPDTRVPLRFGESEHRLVGRIDRHPGTAPTPHPTGPTGPVPHPPPPLGQR